jgi:flagellar biosynthetic protein FlhB
MAQHGEERTEQPTPRRRQKARQKGQIPRSPDLSGAAVLLAGTAALAAFGKAIANGLAGLMESSIAEIASARFGDPAGIPSQLAHLALHTLIGAIGPVLLACGAAGFAVALLQVGGRPAFTVPRFDPKRISPLQGIRNIFSASAAFEALKAVAKTAAVGAVAFLALLPVLHGLAGKVGIPPLALGRIVSGAVFSVAEKAGAAYLLIGFADYLWRRHRIERSLRMTKQEVKEEQRQHSLPAEVKRAQRRRAMALARRRMIQAVPRADVVVTNPTHFAVALSYDGSRPAPEVVAKGQDLIAERIKAVAKEHGVPIVEDPPLARALYAQTEVGDLIPPTLYAAVAKVLAFVYRLAGSRKERVSAR